MYEDIKSAGAEVIGVSSDSAGEAAELRARLDLPFELFADPDCAAIHSLGIFHENEPKGRQIARPAMYVLDADRAIRYRYVGENTRDRPATAEIVTFVQEQ